MPTVSTAADIGSMSPDIDVKLKRLHVLLRTLAWRLRFELWGSRPQGTWRRVLHGGMGRVTQVANEAGLCVFVLVAVVCVCTCECDACLRGLWVCVFATSSSSLPTNNHVLGRLSETKRCDCDCVGEDVLVCEWLRLGI